MAGRSCPFRDYRLLPDHRLPSLEALPEISARCQWLQSGNLEGSRNIVCRQFDARSERPPSLHAVVGQFRQHLPDIPGTDVLGLPLGGGRHHGDQQDKKDISAHGQNYFKASYALQVTESLLKGIKDSNKIGRVFLKNVFFAPI